MHGVISPPDAMSYDKDICGPKVMFRQFESVDKLVVLIAYV